MTDSALPAHGEVSVEVAATPAELWPFVSDPAVPALFSTELQEVTVTVEGPLPIGTPIVGRNARGEFQWTTTSYVVARTEPTQFTWATGDEGDPTATWSLTVAATPTGSILTHAVTFHADKAPLGPAIEREPERAHEIVEGRMDDVRRNMQRTIVGIASLALTGEPGGTAAP